MLLINKIKKRRIPNFNQFRKKVREPYLDSDFLGDFRVEGDIVHREIDVAGQDIEVTEIQIYLVFSVLNSNLLIKYSHTEEFLNRKIIELKNILENNRKYPPFQKS